jgi:hypothetical protein
MITDRTYDNSVSDIQAFKETGFKRKNILDEDIDKEKEKEDYKLKMKEKEKNNLLNKDALMSSDESDKEIENLLRKTQENINNLRASRSFM